MIFRWLGQATQAFSPRNLHFARGEALARDIRLIARASVGHSRVTQRKVTSSIAIPTVFPPTVVAVWAVANTNESLPGLRWIAKIQARNFSNPLPRLAADP